MNRIVCATRGGAGSRAVQMRAIDYARERDARLVFLYVIDVSNLNATDEHLRVAVRNELHWLGQTLLRIAQKRAENHQVSSDIAMREGPVQEEICRFIMEQSADLLLLGAPRGTTATSFGDDIIEQFAQSIEDQTSVTVEIVRPESI